MTSECRRPVQGPLCRKGFLDRADPQAHAASSGKRASNSARDRGWWAFDRMAAWIPHPPQAESRTSRFNPLCYFSQLGKPYPERFIAEGGTAGDWADLGDWLQLASRFGAEEVLFSRGEPIIVSAELGVAPTDADVRELCAQELYRRAWCMSEPRCLFVALPDELRVYLLDRPPELDQSPEAESRPWEAWRTLRDVGEVLALLRDGGDLDSDFRALSEAGGRPEPARADRQLIADLRHVRDQLQGAGSRDGSSARPDRPLDPHPLPRGQVCPYQVVFRGGRGREPGLATHLGRRGRDKPP